MLDFLTSTAVFVLQEICQELLKSEKRLLAQYPGLQQPLAVLDDIVDQLPSGKAVHTKSKQAMAALREQSKDTKVTSLKDVLALEDTPATETATHAVKQFTVRQPFSVVVPCKPGAHRRELKYSEGSIWTSNWRERSPGCTQASYEPLPIQQPEAVPLPEAPQSQPGGLFNQAAQYVTSTISRVAVRNAPSGEHSHVHQTSSLFGLHNSDSAAAGHCRQVSPEPSGLVREQQKEQPPPEQPPKAVNKRRSSPPGHSENAASSKAPVQVSDSRALQPSSTRYRPSAPQVLASAAAQPSSHPLQQQQTSAYYRRCGKHHVSAGAALSLVCLSA